MPKFLKIFFAKAPVIRHLGQADVTPGHSFVKELHSRSTNRTATDNDLLWLRRSIANTAPLRLDG